MDMDLDELDQAVNKMMTRSKGKRSKQMAPSVAAPPLTAPPKVAIKEDEQPIAVKTTHSLAAPKLVVPEGHTGATPAPVRPMRVPERHRTHPGVMDIIQPTLQKPAMAPSAQPPRVAPDLSPTHPVTPEPLTPLSPQPAAEPLPSPDEVSDEVLASLGLSKKQPPHIAEPAKTAHSPWPDPLDFHNFDEKDTQKEPASAPDLFRKDAEKPAASPESPQNTTPFLTTKVEKRPLGAYAATEPAPSPAQEPVATPPKAELAEASIQSNQHMASVEEPTHDMNDLRQMSIPQQYHTADQAKKDDVHNVYDTKEYHATPQMLPVAHKSGSPWLVVGIVVLVVIIVAAVAIGYFMMTGTFDITKLW